MLEAWPGEAKRKDRGLLFPATRPPGDAGSAESAAPSLKIPRPAARRAVRMRAEWDSPPTPSRSHPWTSQRPSAQPAREAPREGSSGAEPAPRFRTRALGRGAPTSSSCLHPPTLIPPRPLFSQAQLLTAGPLRASDPNHRLTPAPTDSRRPLPRYRVSRGAPWSLRNFGLKEKPRTSQSTAFFLTPGASTPP